MPIPTVYILSLSASETTMRKNRNKKITMAFHLLVIVVMLLVAYQRSNIQYQGYVDRVSSELHGITRTVSAILDEQLLLGLVEMRNSRELPDLELMAHDKLASELSEMLQTQGMDDCEISFVMSDSEDGGLVRLVSSDPLYNYGDRIHDRDGAIRNGMQRGGSALIAVNEDIQKLMVFDPVYARNGELIGAMRIETGDLSSQLAQEANVRWLAIPLMIYLLMAAIHIFLIGKINDGEGQVDTEAMLRAELEKKREEMRLLSLMSKKSKNLMFVTDPKGMVQWLNKDRQELIEFCAPNAVLTVGKTIHELSKHQSITTVMRSVADFKESVSYEAETEVEGKRKCYHTTITPITDDDGRVQHLLFVDSDVTQQRIAEEERVIYRSYSQDLALPRMVIDRQGKTSYANESSKQLLNSWREADGSMDPQVLAMINSIADQGVEERIACPLDGEMIQVLLAPAPVKDKVMVIAEQQVTNEMVTQEAVSSSQFRKAG